MKAQRETEKRGLSYRAQSRAAAVRIQQAKSRSMRRAKIGLIVSTFGLSVVLAVALPTDAFAQAAPGTQSLDVSSISQFTGGLAFYALLSCVVGIFISAAMWAMGSKGQNAGTELIGKKGFIVCCAAAFCVGAANPMIAWLNTEAKNPDVDKAQVTQYQPFTYHGMNTP